MKVEKLDVAQAGSKMEREFTSDQSLADQYLAEANAKDLYALYQKRCKELNSFGVTLGTMSEMYAGKSGGQFMPSADAIGAMERVAIAAIDLAKTIASKFDKTK